MDVLVVSSFIRGVRKQTTDLVNNLPAPKELLVLPEMPPMVTDSVPFYEMNLRAILRYLKHVAKACVKQGATEAQVQVLIWRAMVKDFHDCPVQTIECWLKEARAAILAVPLVKIAANLPTVETVQGVVLIGNQVTSSNVVSATVAPAIAVEASTATPATSTGLSTASATEAAPTVETTAPAARWSPTTVLVSVTLCVIILSPSYPALSSLVSIVGICYVRYRGQLS